MQQFTATSSPLERPFRMNAQQRPEDTYKDIKIIVIDKQTDGGGIINKLVLGTSKFDILVTASVLLHPLSTSAASVGPSCNPFIANIDLSTASLHLERRAYGKIDAHIIHINP